MSSDRDRSWRCSGCSFGPATFREMLEHARTHIEPTPDEAPAPPISPKELRTMAWWAETDAQNCLADTKRRRLEQAKKLRALADWMEKQGK